MEVGTFFFSREIGDISRVLYAFCARLVGLNRSAGVNSDLASVFLKPQGRFAEPECLQGLSINHRFVTNDENLLKPGASNTTHAFGPWRKGER